MFNSCKDIDRTYPSVRNLTVLPLVGYEDDSSVYSTDDGISLAEENKCPEVIAVAPISVNQLVNIIEFIQNVS